MKLTRIHSQIEAVTVYREGALVRRVAKIARTDAGFPGSVCVTGLPLAIDDASVRVRVKPDAGDGGAADSTGAGLPIASDVRITLDVPEGDDSLAPPVDEELKNARYAVHRLNGRISQAKRELARVERMVIGARPRLEREGKETPGPSPTASRLALLSLRETHERTLRENLLDFERQLYDAEMLAKELKARYERATSARQAREHELRKALVVALHVDERASETADESDAELVMEYLIPGARWSPAYTVRLNTAGEASFAMRAVVAQHSGEDWTGIRLTLSTADAHSWTELPELTSIRIGRRQSLPAKTGWRPAPSGVDELFRDYDRELKGRGGSNRSAVPSDSSQWEDDTREMTMPRHAAAPAQVSDPYYGGFDDEDDSASLLSDLEEPTVPNLRPPPAPGPVPMMRPQAAPRPAPSAAPMGAAYGAAPPSRARRKSGGAPKAKKAKPRPPGRGGAPPAPQMMGGAPALFGSAAPGGGGGGMPSPDMPDMFGMSGRAEGGVGYRGDDDVTILNASSDMLSYGDLRMPAMNVDSRGRLEKVHRRDVYMELLIEQRIQVTFNVLAVIAAATHQAQAVGRKPLPSRHRLAGSERYDYAYRTDAPVDVPSDGSYHSIALTRRSADTNLSYVVVPRETTDVFRVAELKNPLGAPLLDGPTDVYLGQDFLLTSDVSFTPPGGTVRLGLGVEQAIKVTRNTAYREETSGLLRGSLVLWHKLDIELQNHLERPVECQVRERIPATRKGEDDIEVRVETAEPPWLPYKPKDADSPEANLRGGYHWIVQVPGEGGKKSLSAAYTIKIPSKYELVGGNRREV